MATAREPRASEQLAALSCTTVTDLFRARAAHGPDCLAYAYLANGEEVADQLTYAQLDRRARAIAGTLQALAPPGERAVLVYPSGLDFICAFTACLYAGLIAVPAPAPHPARPDRETARLRAIAEDCDARLVLGPQALFEATSAGRWARYGVATDACDDALADDWLTPALAAPQTALLQYTSGSTSIPRGVIVSHANILANLAAIHDSQGNTSDSRSVTWLPHYHDMGLIEGLLLPAFSGIPAYVLPPTAFLQRPSRWLKAISRLRATNSGGPNFAYDLCVRKIGPEVRAELDLSCWRVAYNGSEPIRADTISNFVEVFSECGLRAESMRTVYGLAEATLLVAASPRGCKPRVVSLCAETLATEQIALPSVQAQMVEAVSCGPSVAETQVVIADAETGRPMADGEIGEVLVAGPGVACGYWGDCAENSRAFAAYDYRGTRRTYLRTGDLGFVGGGELFITGRIKDLIIVRGRKVHPQDIEFTVERSHASIRPGAVAAFSLRGEQSERLVVMAELNGHRRQSTTQLPTATQGSAGYTEIVDQIVGDVVQAHGLPVSDVLLVRIGTVPKTSSGKVRRAHCRERVSGGQVDAVHRWSLALARASVGRESARG